MTKWMWNGSAPTKEDGRIDFERLTIRQVCEWVTETLCDLYSNAREVELESWLDKMPDADTLPGEAPASSELANAADTLTRLVEKRDPLCRSEAAHEQLRSIVSLLNEAVSITSN